MTDQELIKRLREADTYNKKYYGVDPLHQEAADRIEGLMKERERLALAICGGEDAVGYANAQPVEVLEQVARDNAAMTTWQFNQTMHAETKLTKAVEALREIADEASVTVRTWKNGINFKKMYEGWRAIAVARIDIARKTLAELEGK